MASAASLLAAINPAPAPRRHALLQGNVLRHAQIGEQIDFLMNGDDAESMGVVGVGEANGLTGETNFAVIGSKAAAEDVDEGAFARTVFADQGMNAAGL